jgi:hypothetical protein
VVAGFSRKIPLAHKRAMDSKLRSLEQRSKTLFTVLNLVSGASGKGAKEEDLVSVLAKFLASHPNVAKAAYKQAGLQLLKN